MQRLEEAMQIVPGIDLHSVIIRYGAYLRKSDSIGPISKLPIIPSTNHPCIMGEWILCV